MGLAALAVVRRAQAVKGRMQASQPLIDNLIIIIIIV